MSEPIWMSIKIGGNLSKDLYEELTDLLKNTIAEVEWDTIKKLPKNVDNIFRGSSNYGECDDIKAFCETHNLSYIHKCEATAEYDASISYWVPGMKEPAHSKATQSGEAVVPVEAIRPYLNMLIQLVKEGLECIPLLINDSDVGNTVTKMLKSKKPYNVLEKEIKKLLPETLPNIPELTIVQPLLKGDSNP